MGNDDNLNPEQRLQQSNKSPTPDSRDDAKGKSRWGGKLLVIFLGGLVALGVWWGIKNHGRAAGGKKDSPSGRTGAAAAPVPVVAGTVTQKDVPIYLDGP